jgi:hypothetical protein
MLPPNHDGEGRVIEELSHRGCCLNSPSLSSSVWETMNLSILDTVEVAPTLPLSYVNSFLDNFWKLSRCQASVSQFLSVM